MNTNEAAIEQRKRLTTALKNFYGSNYYPGCVNPKSQTKAYLNENYIPFDPSIEEDNSPNMCLYQKVMTDPNPNWGMTLMPQKNQAEKTPPAPTSSDPTPSSNGNQDLQYFSLTYPGNESQFKRNYPNYQQDFPNLVFDPKERNVLVNDCLKSDRYNRAMDMVLRNEGGYEDRPTRIEQPTNKGITQGLYNRLKNKYPDFQNNYPEHVRNLTDEQIKNIYCQEFYKPMKGELINNDRLRNMIIDLSVLRGANIATSSLQNELIFNGSNVTSDGTLGSQSVQAFNNLADPDDFIRRYKQTVKREICNDPQYNNGWINRINRY